MWVRVRTDHVNTLRTRCSRTACAHCEKIAQLNACVQLAIYKQAHLRTVQCAHYTIFALTASNKFDGSKKKLCTSEKQAQKRLGYNFIYFYTYVYLIRFIINNFINTSIFIKLTYTPFLPRNIYYNFNRILHMEVLVQYYEDRGECCNAIK